MDKLLFLKEWSWTALNGFIDYIFRALEEEPAWKVLRASFYFDDDILPFKFPSRLMIESLECYDLNYWSWLNLRVFDLFSLILFASVQLWAIGFTKFSWNEPTGPNSLLVEPRLPMSISFTCFRWSFVIWACMCAFDFWNLLDEIILCCFFFYASYTIFFTFESLDLSAAISASSQLSIISLIAPFYPFMFNLYKFISAIFNCWLWRNLLISFMFF